MEFSIALPLSFFKNKSTRMHKVLEIPYMASKGKKYAYKLYMAEYFKLNLDNTIYYKDKRFFFWKYSWSFYRWN